MNGKKIVIFGAGKIGRSFIGQLFSRAGYEIVFVDAVQPIVDLLNAKNHYKVVIRDKQPETLQIENVRALHASQTEAIAKEILQTDIVAVSVGQAALPLIAPTIAKSILNKYKIAPERFTDIILAENLRDASNFFAGQLMNNLPVGFPVNRLVGFIEASIGKMVPIMPPEVSEKDPLLVYAESYNSLILDEAAFKNPLPDVPGLAPKANIKAWVDRKLFIHNLGHAMAAYFGNYFHPEMEYMYEVLNDENIAQLTRKAMKESGEILMRLYPGEFTQAHIDDHINDLIERFKNKLLGDTVYRVGGDLFRKLGEHDRVATPIRYAIKFNLPFETIFLGYQYALSFQAKDNYGNENENDFRFKELYRSNGLEYMLREISKLDPEKCVRIINEHIKHHY